MELWFFSKRSTNLCDNNIYRSFVAICIIAEYWRFMPKSCRTASILFSPLRFCLINNSDAAKLPFIILIKQRRAIAGTNDSGDTKSVQKGDSEIKSRSPMKFSHRSVSVLLLSRTDIRTQSHNSKSTAILSIYKEIWAQKFWVKYVISWMAATSSHLHSKLDSRFWEHLLLILSFRRDKKSSFPSYEREKASACIEQKCPRASIQVSSESSSPIFDSKETKVQDDDCSAISSVVERLYFRLSANHHLVNVYALNDSCQCGTLVQLTVIRESTW